MWEQIGIFTIILFIQDEFKMQDFISPWDTYDPATDFPNKAKGP